MRYGPGEARTHCWHAIRSLTAANRSTIQQQTVKATAKATPIMGTMPAVSQSAAATTKSKDM